MPFVNQHHDSSISQHIHHFGLSGVPTATQQSVSASTFVHHTPQPFINQHHDSSISQHMHHFGVPGVPTVTQQSISASTFVHHAPQPFVDPYAAPAAGEPGAQRRDVAFIPGWTRKAGHQAPGLHSNLIVGSTLKEDFLGGRKRHEHDAPRSGVEYELQKDERKHLANGPREERLRDMKTYNPINPARSNGSDSWGGPGYMSAPAPQYHPPRINAAMAQQSAIYNRELALQAQRARIGELRMNRICNDGLVYSKRINGTVRDSMNWESNEHRYGK